MAVEAAKDPTGHPELGIRSAAVLGVNAINLRHENPAHRWRQDKPPQRAARIRIMIVAGEPVYREGLHAVLDPQEDIEIVGEAAASLEALCEFRLRRPDVTLLDHRVQDKTGLSLDTLTLIRKEFPSARIIMLTAADGDAEIQRALRAGASSYVLKNASNPELLEIVRSVHRGRRPIPAAVAARLAEHMGSEELTSRELDVLKLIRDGNKNKQIAYSLSISETTVNFHIRNIVEKLQAKDRTHAVTIALRRGHLSIFEE